MTARNYTRNGFFFNEVVGYRGSYLTAYRNGDYGIYAFNSKGGRMTNSDAFHHKDAGFYVGQTPPQTRPRRTIVWEPMRKPRSQPRAWISPAC